MAFELDLADLDERLARVTARVVDRDSGAGVPEARATLKADTSAHRRNDLQDASPDAEGRLSFTRVIPGKHELTTDKQPSTVSSFIWRTSKRARSAALATTAQSAASSLSVDLASSSARLQRR